MKTKIQRAIITLTDTEDGFKASVTFEPAVSDKRLVESLTPSVCAAYRLSALIKGRAQDLGKPLDQRIEPEEPLIIQA